VATYAWQGTPTGSVEHLDLVPRDDHLRGRSVVDLGPERIEYAVELDAGWVFRALRVRSSSGRTLDLARADDGGWEVDGAAREDLAEAVDVDLSFSPFTNTLPIRRLGLAVGEAARIVTAYVAAPSLHVAPDPQRYTRLATDRYLYESLDGDFRREITVDGDGFVVDYPGLFARLPDRA
jgi:uncharacterized protein